MKAIGRSQSTCGCPERWELAEHTLRRLNSEYYKRFGVEKDNEAGEIIGY